MEMGLEADFWYLKSLLTPLNILNFPKSRQILDTVLASCRLSSDQIPLSCLWFDGKGL